jgi:D-amino-acid oxidase
VLGAGIVGLFTADILSRAGHDVTVLSRAGYGNTTSAAAAAVLVPFFPGDPATDTFHRNLRWAAATLAHMKALDARGRFLEEIVCYEFGLDGFLEDGFPVEKLDHLGAPSRYSVIELGRTVAGCNFAVRFSCSLCDTSVFLPWLHDALVRRGVRFRRACLTSASDLEDLDADVVFNCLGYQSVFPDPELYAVFGQSMHVLTGGPPAPSFGVGAGDHAVFTHRRGFHVGSYFLREPGETPRRDLYRRSIAFVHGPFRDLCASVGVVPPSIDLDRMERVNAGVRPFRYSGPRLELDRSGPKAVVHNYGHGAHGWTIGYASAVDAVRLSGLDGG